MYNDNDDVPKHTMLKIRNDEQIHIHYNVGVALRSSNAIRMCK